MNVCAAIMLCAAAAAGARDETGEFLKWLRARSPWAVSGEAMYERPDPVRQFRLFSVHARGRAWSLIGSAISGVEPSGARYRGALPPNAPIEWSEGFPSAEIGVRQAMPSRIGIDLLAWPDRVKAARRAGDGWEADVLCEHTVLICDPAVFGTSANPSVATIQFDALGRVQSYKHDRVDSPTVFTYPESPAGTPFVAFLGGRDGPAEDGMALVRARAIGDDLAVFERAAVAERASREGAKEVPSGVPLPLLPPGVGAAELARRTASGSDGHAIAWPLLLSGGVLVVLGLIAWKRAR